MWTDMATKLLEERYFKKDTNGNIIEDVEAMCRRVADTIAQAERNYGGDDEAVNYWSDTFYDGIYHQEWLPATPILMNAGKNHLSLASCWFLPIEDNMESIFGSLKDAAIIMQAGGGVGFNFSNLRPTGSLISTSQGQASGPCSFLKAYDAMVESVKQGGRRRAACMALLSIHHPDILEFIHIKRNGGINNFNLSVAITDEFMEAVKNNSDYALRDPRDNKEVKRLSAKEVFSTIAENAWTNGDPGLFFIDKVMRSTANPVPNKTPVAGVNPCFHGDTLIAVADGRDVVSIKQLAEEGKDVPVYCYGDGKITIRMGRNPRKTREQVEVWKVTLDDGSYIITTPDHKFLLRDDSKAELRELQIGESLMPFSKYQSHGYMRVNLNNGTDIQEHRLIYEFFSGKELKPYPEEIIHHRDGDKLDNRWDDYREPLKAKYPELPFFSRSKMLDLFQPQEDVLTLATNYNHKITKIEYYGIEDVYNLTVDEYHTVGIVTRGTETGKHTYSGLCTQQCGEQPLANYECCALASIDVAKFVDGKNFDLHRLTKTINIVIRFLDNMIDVNYYPLKQNEEIAQANRRIGLGIMGWADALIMLGIPYGSDEACELASYLSSFLTTTARAASYDLASERGEFPNFRDSIYRSGVARRNSSLTTLAPTGSISILANTSSGIEPLYALSITHSANDRILHLTNETVETVLKKANLLTSELREYIEYHGTIQGFKGLPDWCYRVLVTAHEIAPYWHIKMQNAFSPVENAISKTINMPNDSTIEHVKDAYMLAYETNCLGVTVFRDGCRDKQVLHKGIQEVKSEVKSSKRPDELIGVTYRQNSPAGKVWCTINHDEEGPRETFITLGKAGSDINGMAEALGRLISVSLGQPSNLSRRERLTEFADQLRGIGGRASIGFGNNRVLSVPDAVAKIIDNYLDNNAENKTENKGKDQKDADICPVCGQATWVRESGCEHCISCGESRC